MKAILEFNLPEEREEFNHATNAVAYIAALQELDNHLRGRLKYEELPEEVHDALQSVRDFLHNEACADFSLWR
jgi:hypothetical protein